MAEEQPEGEVPMAKRWESPQGAPPPPPPLPPPPAAPPTPWPGYSPPQYPPMGNLHGQGYLPDYAYSASRRPGAVTALGILSITLGSIGLLANLIGGIYSMGLFTINKAITKMASMPPPGVVTPPSPTGPSAYLRGLGPTDRQTVVAVFAQLPVHSLTAERQVQLDALLERSGKDMVPLPDGAYSPGRVRQAIASFGEQPGVAYGTVGQQYFVTGGGRIELLDDRGVFRPVDESEPVRVAMPTGNQNNMAVQTTSGNAMVVTSYATAYTGTGAPSGPSTMPVMPTFPTLNPTAILCTCIESLISFGLAIFLLVSGILALRPVHAAGRMHLIYALLKIPTVVFGVVAWVWVVNGLTSGMAGVSGTAGPPAGVFGVSGTVIGAVGLIYPIVVLIMLWTRPLREYYRATR